MYQTRHPFTKCSQCQRVKHRLPLKKAQDTATSTVRQQHRLMQLTSLLSNTFQNLFFFFQLFFPRRLLPCCRRHNSQITANYSQCADHGFYIYTYCLNEGNITHSKESPIKANRKLTPTQMTGSVPCYHPLRHYIQLRNNNII